VTCWVVDTSPLIFLAKLGRLDLLRESADLVTLPRAVLAEVHAKPDAATYVIDHACRTWLSVRDVTHRRTVELVQADLDLGEAEVIALAHELGADRVVLDDLDARRFARRVGLGLIGTLGLLLAARLRGTLPSLRAEMERLEALGFRVAPSVVEGLLLTAGEERDDSAQGEPR
jgi:predicted nucleic acid-binding protein